MHSETATAATAYCRPCTTRSRPRELPADAARAMAQPRLLVAHDDAHARECGAPPPRRRSRACVSAIAGHNHHDLYLRPTALLGQPLPLRHHLQRARVQAGPDCERCRRALVILCRHGVGGCQCSRRLCHGLHDTRPHRPEYGGSVEPPPQKCPRRRPTANGHLPRASIPPAARGTSTLANRLRPRPP